MLSEAAPEGVIALTPSEAIETAALELTFPSSTQQRFRFNSPYSQRQTNKNKRINQPKTPVAMSGVTHSHDGFQSHSHSHSHDAFNPAEHGHSHEILDGPGSYLGREMPLSEGRNWADRAFTIGIGGFVVTLSYSTTLTTPLPCKPAPAHASHIHS